MRLVFPLPIGPKIPGAYIRASQFLTRICPRSFGFFAANYIAKYRLHGWGFRDKIIYLV